MNTTSRLCGLVGDALLLHIEREQLSAAFISPFNQNVAGFPGKRFLLERSCSQLESFILWGQMEPPVWRDVWRCHWSVELIVICLLFFCREVRGHRWRMSSELGVPPCWPAAFSKASFAGTSLYPTLSLMKCGQTLPPEQQLNHIWLRVCVFVCVTQQD